MIWLYVDGVDSRDCGVFLRSVPSIISAEKDLEFVEIPGRAGTLTVDHGGYKDADITLECYVRDVANIGKAYQLLHGQRKVVFSSDPAHSYIATFYGQAQGDRVVRNMDAWEFTAPVRLKPFRYYEPAPGAVKFSASGGHIDNPASAPSAPRITITGTGDMQVMIGQYVMEFDAVSGGVIVDSEIMRLMNMDGITNALEHDIDEFPLLEPGENFIQWSGNISSITIEPRWRDR